jgi:hypothetical protein
MITPNKKKKKEKKRRAGDFRVWIRLFVRATLASGRAAADCLRVVNAFVICLSAIKYVPDWGSGCDILNKVRIEKGKSG